MTSLPALAGLLVNSSSVGVLHREVKHTARLCHNYSWQNHSSNVPRR